MGVLRVVSMPRMPELPAARPIAAGKVAAVTVPAGT